MYQTGEWIIYGGEGVCRVEAVGPAPAAAMDQSKTYYTIKPLYHGGVIYAPTDVPVRMRPILTRQQAWKLLEDIPRMQSEYAHSNDPKETAAQYKAYLETYDCVNLLHLIRMIYIKNQEAILSKKGCGQTADRYLRRAKDLLHGELAVALQIPVDEVEAVIRKAAGW